MKIDELYLLFLSPPSCSWTSFIPSWISFVLFSLRHTRGGSRSNLWPLFLLLLQSLQSSRGPRGSDSISRVSCIMQQVPSSKWKRLSEQRAGQRFRESEGSDSWGGGRGWKPADSQHFAQSITEYLTLMYNFSFIMVQTVLSCVCRTENSEISLYKFK